MFFLKMQKKNVYWNEKRKFDESIAEKPKLKRQNQPGKGLKALTPKQILSGLPISLAQLKVENNSQKLKNEIR